MPRGWLISILLCLTVLGCSEYEPTDTFGEADPEFGIERKFGEDPSGSDPSGSGQEPPPPGTPEAPGLPSAPDPKPPGCSFELVWPTTGTDTAQTQVHDAYGPRLLGDDYDWHRGVDLPGRDDDDGFYDPVFAVADGSIYAIGNRPNPAHGAISGFSASAGNVIILEHREANLRPGMPTLYSVYMHLDALELDAFAAVVSVDGVTEAVDLREYFYLDGPDTKTDNRGRRRPTFKTSGAVIERYPQLRRQDPIARIGDSGATYEHLHFELRESEPLQTHAVNPYAYLPHLDEAMHTASLSAEGEVLRAVVEIPRAPAAVAELADLSQQLDVEAVALQILDGAGQVVDELRVELSSISARDDPDQPQLDFEGVELAFSPDDFDSGSPSWRLELEFAGLAEAGLVPGPGEQLALEVVDVCGNRVMAPL